MLVCLDLAESPEVVLAHAVPLAERLGASVHLVTVGQGGEHRLRLALGDKVGDFSARGAAGYVAVKVAGLLDELFGDQAQGLPALELHVVAGGPGPRIVRLAAELDADLIVVGTHGRSGARRLLEGSVAEAVVRRAGCSVLVAREKRHESVLTAGGGDGGSDFPVDVVL